MKLQNGVFPEHVLIEVPKERQCIIEGQNFSTEELPSKLVATYEGIETIGKFFRDVNVAKYSVEPIFSLKIASRADYCGNECYNVESINRLCRLISQPWMRFVRSSVLEDKFVTRDTGENPYWIYTPNDEYHLTYVKNGKIWSTNIIACEHGYYYELIKSGDSSLIKKAGDKSRLSIYAPKAVKPVVFLDAKSFEKMSKSLVIS